MNETSGADIRDCTKTRRTNVFVPAKKKKKLTKTKNQDPGGQKYQPLICFYQLTPHIKHRDTTTR